METYRAWNVPLKSGYNLVMLHYEPITEQEAFDLVLDVYKNQLDYEKLDRVGIRPVDKYNPIVTTWKLAVTTTQYVTLEFNEPVDAKQAEELARAQQYKTMSTPVADKNFEVKVLGPADASHQG